MLALRKNKAVHGLQVQDVERISPGKDEVLIRVKATGVCGTDLHIAYSGERDRRFR